MDQFKQHSGIAAPLLQPNIDTDAIIPSREMKVVSKHGLGEGLFAHWRYLAPGSRDENTDFILNQAPYRDASILLTGDNFGCGSSREHAVWALKEFGIRVIIAAGFGSIFYNNCVANGLLPITLDPGHIQRMASEVESEPSQSISVDLEANTVHCGERDYSFELEENHRQMLLQGLDPIGLTLLHQDAIDAFEVSDRKRRSWAYS